MEKKNNIDEISTDMTTYNKIKGTMSPDERNNVTITGDKPEVMEEEDAVIEPKDDATIKYLSKIQNKDTGETSQPFTIDGKTYQMGRGHSPSTGEIQVVLCLEDNVVYTVEDFDRDIATPMKEMLEQQAMDEEAELSLKADTYENCKHFFVNKKTNEVRKFKSIVELVGAQKLDEEDYMGIKEFKRHMNEKMFGRRKKLGEEESADIANQQERPDVTKAIEQMVMKIKPSVDRLKEPIEKIQFIAKLTTMLGIDQSKMSLLISTIKSELTQSFDTAKPTTEGKIITKNDLIESMTTKKVIKTIKIKDIK
jgi:hypothetical protein